jgi:hypothetical protein
VCTFLHTWNGNRTSNRRRQVSRCPITEPKC